MTWVEVVDSAVKIGLGAVVAGFFGYTTMLLTHDRSARSEYAKRRRDMLEKVLNMMSQFDKTYRHQKAIFDSLCQVSPPEYREKLKQRFEELDEELRIAFEKFADASATLLLLGETQADATLEAYRKAASQWYDLSLPELSEMSHENLNKIRSDIIEKRYEMMAMLATAYKAQ